MNLNIRNTIVVLGEGAWGTALATLFVRNGYSVTLWCHHPEIAEEINQQHTNNRYMPGFIIPKTLKATADSAVIRGADFICEALPVQYMRAVIAHMRHAIPHDALWIITSKGIEQETLLLPAALVTEILGYEPRYGVVVGPSFARDVMQEKRTGLLVAAQHTSPRDNIMQIFTNSYVSCVPSTDTHGAQLCAAFKNVVALLVGISDGRGYGDNARALLVTQCFQKMAALVQASGGALDTVLGLAGIGDLFLTATSTQSRNYSVGKSLGAGEPLHAIIERTGFTPESINTIRSLRDYARQYGISLDDLIDQEYARLVFER